MTEQKVLRYLRYLRLLDRKITIAMRLGVSWEPEYEQELKDIDSEILTLREKVEEEHKKRTLT